MKESFAGLRLGGIAVILLGVTACQTASSLTKLDTPDARFAIKIISRACIFGIVPEGQSIHDSRYKASPENVFSIRSITKGVEGWWRAGYIFKDNYWYFFVNKKKNLAYCGEEAFRRKGHHFRKVKETISDNAMAIAFGNSGYSSSSQTPKNEDHSNDTNESVCNSALHNKQLKWSSLPVWGPYVTEAKKRNLTPQQCAKLTGRT